MRGTEFIEEEAERWNLTDTPVKVFSIIPDQVLHHLDIEVIQVVDMAVNELVLHGLIESFEVDVGLRLFRIIEEVNESVLPAVFIEVFFEFAAVIGLDPRSGEKGNRNEFAKEVAAVGRGV